MDHHELGVRELLVDELNRTVANPMEQPHTSNVMGSAVTVSLVLSDWERYGLGERCCWHFDLTEALAGSEFELTDPHETNQKKSSNDPVCGVVTLLECVPSTPWQKLTKKQKRGLKNAIGKFNQQAQAVRAAGAEFCHEPPRLPLRLSTLTRVFFAYETTRIAFCLDASATLTSTFGFGSDSDDKACCPLDRLVGMARTFFLSLVEPMPAPTMSGQDVWKPVIAITVQAVFPRTSKGFRTSLLVRGFQLTDAESAELLVAKLEEWALGEVEVEIAKRLAEPAYRGTDRILQSFDTGTLPMYSSSISDLVAAGEAALSTLSSAAKPCIILATDARNLCCDGFVDLVPDPDLVDTPLMVLDLSSPTSHNSNNTAWNVETKSSHDHNLLNYDPLGPIYPLHMSDDSEALQSICKLTHGCFFDSNLLTQAARTRAGRVDQNSPFLADIFFSSKHRSILANAIQWYTLFSLSPLSPQLNSAWGKLVAPDYLRSKLLQLDNPYVRERLERKPSMLNLRSDRQFSAGSDRRTLSSEASASSSRKMFRAVFSAYHINPVQIKSLLLVRVKEGYRTRQYGQSTSDPDKVSIQFALLVDSGNAADIGTVIHYELSYKGNPTFNHMVGEAHIKIELSGEPSFVQMVKSEFLHQSGRTSHPSVRNQLSSRLCRLLRSIRKEDMLQSYLSPLVWCDELNEGDGPFLRRIGTITQLQRNRHFQCEDFDCVCTGQMPYEINTDIFLPEFRDLDDGHHELEVAVGDWSSATIVEGKCFMKKALPSNIPMYGIIKLLQISTLSRVVTVNVSFFGQSRASDRAAFMLSLKRTLTALRDVEVLPKQMARFLVGTASHQETSRSGAVSLFLEGQHNHATWDLVKDPELLPLLMRRRREIGNFFLLESNSFRMIFAKFITGKLSQSAERNDPGDLVQYQMSVLDDRVVVDLYIESEGGEFFPLKVNNETMLSGSSTFTRMAKTVRKKDQECGRALQCRTSLLRIFDNDVFISTNESIQRSCVSTLLGYASSAPLRLRFFHEAGFSANEKLEVLVEESLLHRSLGPKVAKLSINSKLNLSGSGVGDWFLLYFDSYTISFACLSRSNQEEVDELGRSQVFRALTLYTLGIGDLYNRRDDVTEEEAEDDHISEHFCVSEFLDAFSKVHQENFSTAAYAALANESLENSVRCFHLDDFAEVLSPLTFVNVARVVVAGENMGDSHTNRSKLISLLKTVVQTLEDEHYCFVFKLKNGDSGVQGIGDSVLSDSMSSGFDHDSEHGMDWLTTENGAEDMEDTSTKRSLISENEMSIDEEDDEFAQLPTVSSSAPIFVRFLLDNKAASIFDLARIPKSAELTAQISVFRTSGRGGQQSSSSLTIDRDRLPQMHAKAARELESFLNAYVAEQTLERLRHQGSGIGAEELRLAKRCMRGARDVLTSCFELVFYVSKVDALVPLQDPAGCTIEVETAIELLRDELLHDKEEHLLQYGDNTFVSIEGDTTLSALPYWCFVVIQKSRGSIAIEVLHPHGIEKSLELLNRFDDFARTCCHKVNQILLLERLHKSRQASNLLIASDSQNTEDPTAEQSSRAEGSFQCPVIYRTSFELFHRCATNPIQVARRLEATVFHIFAIQNRTHIFVYQDESGSIFYMTLVAAGGGVEPDGTIELVVHGIEPARPSVTAQLRILLQKRLLSIAVETLSGLLVKNPYYNWRRPDLDFVRSFESEWRAVNESIDESGNERTYIFPDLVHDPSMVLLFFRQNLCGSTYFHPLICAEWESRWSGEMQRAGVNMVFYYNNAPTKVDPKFQAQSTLTEKGAEFSRQAGTGIAIIEITVIQAQTKHDHSTLASTAIDYAYSSQSSKNLLMIKQKNFQEVSPSEDCLSVRITATALNKTKLHEWIQLTWNQSIVAWTIERSLEKEQKSMVRDLVKSCESDVDAQISLKCSDKLKRAAIDDICKGLPTLINILDFSADLPHPAVLKREYTGVVRSSAVASVTYDLLQKVIFEQLLTNSPRGTTLDFASDLCIIRLSRNERPCRVQLDWDPKTKRAVAHRIAQAREFIHDAPIACPEYLVFYRTKEYTQGGENELKPPKMFEKVVVSGEADGLVSAKDDALSEVAIERDSVRRSFAFILSVKRNRRVLVAYNWSIQLFRAIAPRLEERNDFLLRATGESVDSLQKLCLGELSPISSYKHTSKKVVNSWFPRRPKESGRADKETKVDTKESTNEISRPMVTRRITRPLTIRRPRLVGKSVEGAALHAVAASRARASSKTFKPAAGTTTVGNIPKADRAENSRIPATSSPEQVLTIREAAKSEDRSLEDEHQITLARQHFASTVFARRHRFFQPKASIETQLLCSRWPLTREQSISIPRSKFLLSLCSIVWNDMALAIELPKDVITTFIEYLGNAIAQWTPGIHLVTTSSSERKSPGFNGSVLLMSNVKKLRTCKAFIVIRISGSNGGDSNEQRLLVRSNGYVLTLPRNKKNRGKRFTHYEICKDATGLDKLAMDVRNAAPIERSMFDCCGSMVEQSMKSTNSKVNRKQAFCVLHEMIDSCPLEKQMTVLQSNYKCYEVNIILSSYRSPFIDKFPASTLFLWMRANCVEELVECGEEAVCFSSEVLVKGTCSFVFLRCDSSQAGRMKLMILTRTQGLDLYSFTFRERSSLALSIADAIAVEAAGLAYGVLQDAASSLCREKLWHSLATGSTDPSKSHDDQIRELLGLCETIPFEMFAPQCQSERSIFGKSSFIDWMDCCLCMRRDPAFSPSYLLDNGVEAEQMICYAQAEDLFIMITLSPYLKIDFVNQIKSPRATAAGSRLAQKLINYFTHFAWGALLHAETQA